MGTAITVRMKTGEAGITEQPRFCMRNEAEAVRALAHHSHRDAGREAAGHHGNHADGTGGE